MRLNQLVDSVNVGLFHCADRSVGALSLAGSVEAVLEQQGPHMKRTTTNHAGAVPTRIVLVVVKVFQMNGKGEELSTSDEAGEIAARSFA